MHSSQGGGGGGGNSEHAMHHVTLKFPDRAAETAYVRKKSDQLVANFRKCCVVLCLSGLGSFSMYIAALGFGACTPWDCDTQDPTERARMESLWATIPLSLMSASLGAVTKIPCITRTVGPVCWEVTIAALVIFAMASQLFCSSTYWGRIRGLNTSVGDVDSISLILVIDVFLTGSHLALPIRWCMLVPVQVGGVLLYVAASLVLGGTGNWTFFAIPLIVLAVFASMGRRSIERHQRQDFKSFIAEKTLRVEMEFQLSQVGDQGRARGEDQRSVAGVSVPSTTESAHAFALGPGLPSEAEEGAPGLPAISRVGLHEQWLIGAGQVRLRPEEVLGEGSFGQVVRGSYCGTPVAVKLPKEGQWPSQPRLIELCNELRILRRLRHPNIVSFFGALLDSGRGFLALVLELVDGVSLRDFILPLLGGLPSSGARGISVGTEGAPAAASAAASAPVDVDRVTVLADISCALWYLHTRQPVIVHGDLKDSNIFVEPGGLRERPCRAKLLDFGLSRAITKHARPLGGSRHWMAPEVIQQEGTALSTAADVFSFSRLAFFVVTSVHPATVMTRNGILELAERGQLPQMRWPRERDGLTRSFREITERCHTFDPAARPLIADVHPVFSAWLGSAGPRRLGGTGAGQGAGEGPQEEAAAAAVGPYVMDPRFGLTPRRPQVDSLMDVMMRYHIDVSQSSCRPDHSSRCAMGSSEFSVAPAAATTPANADSVDCSC